MILPAFIEMAPCLHTPMHSAQFMHSRSPTWRTSILQFIAQAPQCVHRSASTFTPMTASLLNMPYIAPSGHRNLQNER